MGRSDATKATQKEQAETASGQAVKIISRSYFRILKAALSDTQGDSGSLHEYPNGYPSTKECGFHEVPNGYPFIDIYQGTPGYRTVGGLLLNCCCVFCRVWITDERLEFDGMRHRCNRADNEKHRKPWLDRRRKHQEQSRAAHAEKIAAKRAALRTRRVPRGGAV
jgi:hypothetical protein